MAERSVVFLTREAAHRTIRETPFLSNARTIANIYLLSLGAPTLAGSLVQSTFISSRINLANGTVCGASDSAVGAESD